VCCCPAWWWGVVFDSWIVVASIKLASVVWFPLGVGLFLVLVGCGVIFSELFFGFCVFVSV
jgi:hypothetical protein